LLWQNQQNRIEPNCPVVRRAAQGTEKHKPRQSSLGPEEGLEVGSVFVSCEEDGVNAFQDGQIDACASHHDCVFDSFAGALCRFIHFLFSFVGSVMEDLVVGKKSRTRLQGSSSRGRVSKRRGAACRRCCCGEEGAVISFFLSFFLWISVLRICWIQQRWR
jgi:hypothetical protein